MSVEALVFVCSESLTELETLTASLDGTNPKTISARLRQIGDVAATLSGGLDKLSKFMDELPTDDPNAIAKGPPVPRDDGGLLLQAAQVLVDELEGEIDGGTKSRTELNRESNDYSDAARKAHEAERRGDN